MSVRTRALALAVSALALTLSQIATSAQASIDKRACKFDEFQLISRAIEAAKDAKPGFAVSASAEDLTALSGLLMEEMGPKCFRVFNLNALVGIPEYNSRQFEVDASSTGRGVFSISISSLKETIDIKEPVVSLSVKHTP